MEHPDLLHALADPERLAVLAETELLDSEAESAFDRLTRLAAKLLRVPTALLTFLDDRRAFFKSQYGMREPLPAQRGSPLSHSFCKYAVAAGEPFLVENAPEDPRVSQHPATLEYRVVAYAGVPIRARNQVLGALCVVDDKPRHWDGEQIELLCELGQAAATEIELRLALSQLSGREEQLRLTIDNAPVGMALIGLDGRFLRVNRALCQIVGYSAEQLLALTFQQITHPDDLAPDLALRQQLLEGTIASYQLQKRYLHQSGAPVDIRLYVALVRDRSGLPLHFAVQLEDITVRLFAEAELAHKTMILESVLNHMSDGVIVADIRGDVLLFNPAAHAMLGGRPDSAFSDWSAEFGLFESDGVTPIEPERVPIRRALRGEYVDQHELFALPRAGSMGRWRTVTATPLRGADGAVWAALTVSRDVTRFKQSELELRDQSAIIRLLEAVAVAANEATTSSRAMTDALDLVCEFMGWPVGHVYLVDGLRLLPSDMWHLKDPQRFAAFRDVTSRTHLSVGLELPGRALKTCRPAWMEDVQTDPSFLRARAATRLGVHGGLAFPVVVDDEVIAVMEFYSDTPQVPDARQLEVLHHVGTQLGRVVERERHAEAVRSLSLTDELTGLNNRRGFLALAQAQLRLAARHDRHACLLFLDMDGLKQINDQLGHEAGDAALADVATILRATFRDSDILGRLGGDEFVALLTDTTPAEQGLALSRLQEAVTLHNVTQRRSYVLALSVGVTSFDPQAPVDIESLLSRADGLMYEQKRRRKGRTSPIVRH
jgi:diguanylate cyclase (GGDEF)-like protein/PAS domain S-box-containing protein